LKYFKLPKQESRKGIKNEMEKCRIRKKLIVKLEDLKAEYDCLGWMLTEAIEMPFRHLNRIIGGRCL